MLPPRLLLAVGDSYALLPAVAGPFTLRPADDGPSPRQRALTDQHSSLQRHVMQCHQARSRWNGLGCAAELVHGLLAPRFVTTVTVVVMALALSACGT